MIRLQTHVKYMADSSNFFFGLFSEKIETVILGQHTALSKKP